MWTGLVAFAAAGAFLGASLYINIVEQPARASLDDRAMMKEWRPSERRGFVMLASLALLSAIFGVLAYASQHDLRWLIAAIIILASWPYVFFLVVPLNNSLLSMEADPPSFSRNLVQDWGLLEWGMTVIGLVAVLTFGWALS